MCLMSECPGTSSYLYAHLLGTLIQFQGFKDISKLMALEFVLHADCSLCLSYFSTEKPNTYIKMKTVTNPGFCLQPSPSK